MNEAMKEDSGDEKCEWSNIAVRWAMEKREREWWDYDDLAGCGVMGCGVCCVFYDV